MLSHGARHEHEASVQQCSEDDADPNVLLEKMRAGCEDAIRRMRCRLSQVEQQLASVTSELSACTLQRQQAISRVAELKQELAREKADRLRAEEQYFVLLEQQRVAIEVLERRLEVATSPRANQRKERPRRSPSSSQIHSPVHSDHGTPPVVVAEARAPQETTLVGRAAHRQDGDDALHNVELAYIHLVHEFESGSWMASNAGKDPSVAQ